MCTLTVQHNTKMLLNASAGNPHSLYADPDPDVDENEVKRLLANNIN